MLKVTTENVMKLSEDSLYLALAVLKEGSDTYLLVDAELDRRAKVQTDNLKKRQDTQVESLKLTQAIQSEIAAIFEGFKGVRTLFLIENLGQEFIDDYTIDDETFTVYSKVSHEIYHNPTSWEFDSIEKLVGKWRFSSTIVCTISS